MGTQGTRTAAIDLPDLPASLGSGRRIAVSEEGTGGVSAACHNACAPEPVPDVKHQDRAGTVWKAKKRVETVENILRMRHAAVGHRKIAQNEKWGGVGTR